MGNLLRFKSQLAFMVATLLMTTSAFAATVYTTAGVNVRQSPWGEILTGLPEGTEVNTLSKRNNFYRVEFGDGRIGWIHSKYVSQERPKNFPTEGEYCEGCLNPSVGNPVAEASENIKKLALYGRGQACIASKIIQAAKSTIRNRYGNRTRGKGKCALAVRQALNKANIWPGGGIGHAKDMMPGLRKMGFVNVKTAKMTPENAPDGSILVYGRPSKSEARGCRGLGTLYGHIEIKENDNSYLYDGRVKKSIQKAFSRKCRPLIGVMKMGSECKTCTKSVKRSCGV